MTALMETYRPFPVTFVEGTGSRLVDDQGRSYLDWLSGIAVVSLGHRNPAVTAAMQAQMSRLSHVSNYFSNERAPRAAQMLDGKLGGGGRVFFCNSGAEANEAAIKLARRAGGAGRHVVVTATGSFHGRTLATLHATGQPAKHLGYEPLPAGFRHVQWGSVAALEDVLAQPDVAAFLVEPVQGESGIRVADAGFMQAAERLCRDNGVLFMVDEIQSGMCRTGRWFAHEHFGVSPDVVTLAKALGNGFPVGACWAREQAAAAFAVGSHGTTFGGQPLATAVVEAVLSEMDRIDAPTRAARLGGLLAAGLSTMPGVTEVRGLGLLRAVETVEASWDVAQRALDLGLIVNPVTPTALRIAPALTMTDAELEEGLSLLRRALTA